MEEDYNDELYAHFFKALFQLREIWSSIMINHESKVDTMRSLCLMPCSVMDLHGTFFLLRQKSSGLKAVFKWERSSTKFNTHFNMCAFFDFLWKWKEKHRIMLPT